MADSTNSYITNSSFEIGSQIALLNKNSNIDRFYGPYDGSAYSLDDINEYLKKYCANRANYR